MADQRPTPTDDDSDLLAKLLRQLDQLPIFPLQKVHLFPGSLLPLYIFEPRYRDMTAHCLAGGGGLAVATLIPGFEADYQGRPPVRPIAGAGQIIAHRKNDDGTYNLLLRGVARIRIIAELPPARSFREVRAAVIPDVLPADFDDTPSRAVLTALIDRLAHAFPDGGESLHALCSEPTGPGPLADVLAAALVQGEPERLALLEEPHVPTRLERVSAEIARLVTQVARQSGGCN